MQTLKNALLGFAGIFGYSAEVKLEKDIESAIAAPTEGGIDTVITDAAAVIEHLDKNIPAPVMEASANIAIALVGFAYNPSVKGGTLIGGEILAELPKINAKWSKVTPEHAAAFTQVLADIEGDYGM